MEAGKTMQKATSVQPRKRIFLSPPHMGGQEGQFIREVFESNYIAPFGPQLAAFEREFSRKSGLRHAVALSSGTAAIHLALRNLGIGHRDEVFASTLTFIGSITPILFQGGVPVFIDSERTSWNMDPTLLAEELEACRRRGRLPKAVVPTDIYGQCADLERILEVCRPFDIPVVVDAAEALGAKYKRRAKKNNGNGNSELKTGEDECGWLHAGVGAKAAIFSFNGNKIITTSGGGMLASNDAAFIEQARFLSQQARDAAPHYEHSQIGYNYRMSNLVAAIGLGQLQVLEARVEQKRRIFNFYKEALSSLPGIEFMPEATYSKSTRWLTVILIHPDEFGTDRESVRLALEAENIESRPIWKPMHLQPIFATEKSGSRTKPGNIRQESQSRWNTQGLKYKARVVGRAVSEYLFERGLCLPSGTQMTDDELDRIVRVIRKVQRG
jgi:dTDP-4-amino-4,6-dideoxygalactose transaminase